MTNSNTGTAPAKATITLTATQDKETKGTFRFAEDAEAGVRPTVGTLYILKTDTAKLGNPTKIRVTIEAV